MFWKGFRLFGMPWSIAHQNPLSMEFLRQEYWSGLLFPSPESYRARDRTHVFLPFEPPAKPIKVKWVLRLQHSSSRCSVFMKRNAREFSLLALCLCVLSSVCPPPPPPCEDAHRSHPGKKEFSAEPHLLVPWSGTSSSQNWKEINFSCLFHWVYFILLWHS